MHDESCEVAPNTNKDIEEDRHSFRSGSCNDRLSDTYCAPLGDVPLDAARLQHARLSGGWPRRSGAFGWIHHLHVAVVSVDAGHTAALCAVAALSRTLGEGTCGCGWCSGLTVFIYDVMKARRNVS